MHRLLECSSRSPIQQVRALRPRELSTWHWVPRESGGGPGPDSWDKALTSSGQNLSPSGPPP